MAELQVGEPPSEPTRSKQFWLPSSDSIFLSDIILEIMGFTHDNPPLLNVRPLRTKDQLTVTLLKAVYVPKTPLMGGVSKFSYPPLEALLCLPINRNLGDTYMTDVYLSLESFILYPWLSIYLSSMTLTKR